jgi:acetolactate synthase I/II/III large subunit
MRGTDFILDCLAKEGIKHLFMVPGGLVDPFLEALGRQTAIKPIVAAHEGGAAYMADGYARASCNFGAVLCIGGPGLTNTITAVAAAQTDGSPLFVISGETSTQMEGLGTFQDASDQTLDDVSILKPITRYTSSVNNPKNLRNLFRRAMVYMRTEPTGPVHLSIPQDSLSADISAGYDPVGRQLKHAGILSLDGAEETLSHFKVKENAFLVRIAILAGAGVEHSQCSSALIHFAEKWSVPVATTLRAKGVFPEDHPLSLGVFGYAGTHHSRMALLDNPLDLLIVLGLGFNERDSMKGSLKLSPEKAICVNLNILVMGTHFMGSNVIGDIGAYFHFLESRTDQIAESLKQSREKRESWLAAIKEQARLQDPENCQSSAVPIHPARVVSELRKALPREGIVLIDSGAHRAFSGHYWQSYAPLTYFSATNLGPMGWAIPAAVGVQFAQSSKKVAVITGDGCMRMHGIDIATAARYQLPIVYVVMNNASLGNVWLRLHQQGPVPDELTSLPNHDWAMFARSLGLNGITVSQPDDLAIAFEKALQNKGPTVIDVKIDKRFLTPIKDWSLAFSYHE